ncbi:ATP-binding protein [Bacteroides sp.]|uniref:ATP-binding protein n=1 Tax=Bacteroides sp. TaxID=29523 RepID=UPI0025C00D26|nr:ATP-binding protein [Bacteroides sp.]
METNLEKIPQDGKQKEDRFEPMAKVLAANAVAQSLSFTMERKYLNEINKEGRMDAGFKLESIHRFDSPLVPYWIEIERIGKPLDNNVEHCFSTIQKILTACFLPKKTQLIFLVHSENGVCHLYIGIRPVDSREVKFSFVDSLSDFIEGIWPGIKCRTVKGRNRLDFITNKIKDEQKGYDYVYSITGIPSMESQYKSIYPATVDKLIAGMRKKNFSYLVVADPVPEQEIDEILYKCRDFNGQAESLKSFNFSEGTSEGTNESFTQAKGIIEGISDSISRKKIDKYEILDAGLLLASSFFPPASVAVASCISRKTESIGINQSQNKSISQNLVNKHIESVSEHLFYHSKRFETGKAIGCWNVGVYLMAEKEADIQSASLQLRSILSGQESIFEPVRIHDISSLVDEEKNNTLALMAAPMIRIKTPSDEYFEHPLGDHFKELRTLLTTKELSYLINFPLRAVPGISVIDSSPEFSLNQQDEEGEQEITFGKLLYGGTETKLKYHIPVDVLSRHTLLSGINGSGKTNTVQAILNGLDMDFPFLAIEPAKTEYVDWALNYNELHPENPIDIYIPGCKKYKTGFEPKQLKLNPFELVWLKEELEPNVLTHIDRLKSTFAAAFPMYDILPVLMEDLIYTVYQNKSTDWLGKEPVFGVTLPPTLNSMSVCVDKVISNRQYEERIERNMKACLNTRIDSLKRGWKGEMLNTLHSTFWTDLFGKRCIVNLSYVGDDIDKSFFMALILQFLYEYCAAQAEAGQIDFNDNTCRHLTVIEEAHRVMPKCENQELPQYKSAMMFSNMLSEIRAYGEGIFLVDQVPTRLIPDAIKNTNLKITHRMVAEDDCKAISESMGLNDEQRKVIAKLMTGQCVVSSSLSTDTYWVQVNRVK